MKRPARWTLKITKLFDPHRRSCWSKRMRRIGARNARLYGPSVGAGEGRALCVEFAALAGDCRGLLDDSCTRQRQPPRQARRE
jgi:hypothetical protein